MLSKHLLKFGVNGGEDDRRKNVGKKIFECLDILCMCMSILVRYGITKCIKKRIMAPKIQLLSTS